MKKKVTKKERLIMYITTHDKFYEFASMAAHSDEQLKAIRKRIKNEKKSESESKDKC